MGRRTFFPPALALLAALGVTPPSAVAQPTAIENAGIEPAFPRVRTTNPAIATLLRRGAEASATFKQLVATIDATDGIVFIEEGKCGHSVHACLLLSVTMAGPNRVLRVNIDTHDAAREVISSIGHELWHAIEALKEPSVRDGRSLFNFFQQEGPTDCGRFETEGAIHAGLAVRSEIGAVKR